MAFCGQCGVPLHGGSKFCHQCGSGVKKQANQASDVYYAGDIEANRIIAALAYLPCLFFLPLVACPGSAFGRYHANQGLALMIVSVIWGVTFSFVTFVLGFIPILGHIAIAILSMSWLAFFGLFILGIINALGGRTRELPVIGRIKIIT